jgi:hypothetical protein
VNPREETVLIVLPEQRVKLLRGKAALPVLEGVELLLSVAQVFEWLQL